jgi:hypothetical protein
LVAGRGHAVAAAAEDPPAHRAHPYHPLPGHICTSPADRPASPASSVCGPRSPRFGAPHGPSPTYSSRIRTRPTTSDPCPWPSPGPRPFRALRCPEHPRRSRFRA